MMSLLNPQSVAVIGASATEGKLGHEILKNLTDQGFEGEIIPVNPKGGKILGKAVQTSVSDIDGSVDIAVVVVPAKIVPAVAKECADKNIENIIVITAGFSETHTEEGKRLEEELRAICIENNINLIGPNCLGVIRPSQHLNASFAKELPPAGSVALISQSGAFAVAIMDASASLGLAYSTVFSIGNKTTMDAASYIEICRDDPETKVIGLYLENIRDGRRFLEVAREVAQEKPIVLLKAGVSEHGKKAAASHTGALAGTDASIDAVCAQTGMHRAHNLEEFTDLLKVLSTQPALPSNNIAIITNAGGPGILATDAAEPNTLQLVSLEEETLASLKENLPSSAGLTNPIDVIGDAGLDRYLAALEAVCGDTHVDGLVVLLTPQVMTPVEDVAHAIIETAKKHPLMPIVTSFMGDANVRSGIDRLTKEGIPNFETPERAVAALASLRPKETIKHETAFETSGMRATRAQELLHNKSGLVDQEITGQLFELYGLQLPKQQIAKSAEEAVDIANEIGYPVIAKISAPDVIHKTDIGGIKANLQHEQEVQDAFNEIPGDVLIQQFLPIGSEFIIGGLSDPSFGPLIMVGLGGIYTELFKDTAFRIAPINEQEAYAMLQELQAWKILMGMRGKEQLAIDRLASIVATISELLAENPGIKELDLNPVIVGTDQIVIADVKIMTK